MWLLILLSLLVVFGLTGWFLPVAMLIALSAAAAVAAILGFRYAVRHDSGSGGIAYGWSILTCAAVVVGWAAYAIHRFWS